MERAASTALTHCCLITLTNPTYEGSPAVDDSMKKYLRLLVTLIVVTIIAIIIYSGDMAINLLPERTETADIGYEPSSFQVFVSTALLVVCMLV